MNSLFSRFLMVVMCLFGLSELKAQMKVTNGKLYDTGGNQVIIRGANVLTQFWDAIGYKSDTDASGDWSKTGDYTFSQLTQTGANTARILWRRSNGYITTPAIALDYTIANCIKNNIVPMIMMYDVTGAASVADFNKEIDYLLSPDVAAVLKKYQNNLIVNLANEWEVPNSATGSGAPSDADIRNAYGPAIIRMRNAGINCPLVIDAMYGYASEESTIQNNASYLKSQDIKDNLIFSIHCYDGLGTTKGSQARMKAVMDWAVNNSICFIWGEFNYVGNGFTGNMDWQYLIQYAQTTGTGWLAWAWWDPSANYVLAFNRQFRAWAGDVNWSRGVTLDNPNGIQQTAVKSLALPQQDVSASIGVSSGTLPPNPVSISFPNSGLAFAIDPAVNINRQGASLIQTAYTGNNSQLWNLVSDGNGYYKIVNVASGKVMEVAGGSTAVLANIQQGTNYNRNFQLWAIQSDGAGKFKIRSKHADLSPIIESEQTTAGLPVETYSYTGQTFTIQGRGGPAVAVTGISVNPASASITINGTQQLTAIVTPSNASNQSVTWASSNGAVATVGANGLVTGISAGTAVITATTNDGSKTATATLTVTPAVNLVDFDIIIPTVQAVVAGKVQYFAPPGGTVSIVTNPQVNATNGSTNVGKYDKPAATFSLLGFYLPAAQSLTGFTNLQFQIYGPSLTEAYVKLINDAGTVIFEGLTPATTNNNWLTVNYIFPSASTAAVRTINIFPNPNEATAKTFYVDNLVLKAGTSSPILVSSVAVTPNNTPSIPIGTSLQFTATVLPANATNKNVTWKSANTAIVTVSATGLVTGVGNGLTTITATSTDGTNKISTVAVGVPLPSGSFIYNDALQNSWTTSSNSTYNLNNTTQVKNGTKAISVQFAAYGSLDFNHSPALSTSGYSKVTFWGYGAPGAANKVQFFFFNASGTQTGIKQLVLTGGQWVQYTINLSEVGSPASISKITLQDYAGIYPGVQPAFYLDDLTFSTLTGARLANDLSVRTTAPETGTDKGMVIYPQPSEGTIHVSLWAEQNQEATLHIISLNGSSQSFKKQLIRGENVIELPASQLSTGIYLLKTAVDGKQMVKKFIK